MTGVGRLVVVIVVLACTVLPVVVAQTSGGAALDLHIAPEFELANSTLLIGRLSLDVAGLEHPGFVHVQRLVATPVNLTVCPIDDAGDGVVRGLLLADPSCDGGETFFMPQVRFGPRSSLQFAGVYGARPPTSGAMSLFVPEGRDGPSVVSVLGHGSVPFSYRDDQMRFQPVISSSQVIITTNDERATYNGTDWRFLFGGAGEATMIADGFHASVGDKVRFDLARMPANEIANATRMQTLVDLQAMMLGPDAREPIANATRLLDLSRSPVFLNGAVVGRLNGTVDGRDLADEPLAQVRFASLSGTLTDDRLVADGRYDLVLLQEGVVVNDSAGSPPWILATVLWIGAVLAFVLGRDWHAPHAWVRWFDLTVPVVVLFVVDRIVAWRVGVGAFDLLLAGDYALGVGLRLLVFDIAAALGLLLLVYLPLRIVGRHVIPGRWGATATPAAMLLALLYGFLASADLIALAFTFVRL